MNQDEPQETKSGRTALWVAVLGLIIPGTIFWMLHQKWREDVVWGSGAALYALLFFAIITAVSEIVALVLAALAWRGIPAKIAAFVSILTLSAMAWFVISARLGR